MTANIILTERMMVWKTNNFFQFPINAEPGSFETDTFMFAFMFVLYLSLIKQCMACSEMRCLF